MLRNILDKLENVSMVNFEDRTALNMFNKNIDDFIALYVKDKKYKAKYDKFVAMLSEFNP